MNNFLSNIRGWISATRLSMKLLVPSLLIFVLVIVIFLAYITITFITETQAREIETTVRTEQIVASELQKLNDFALGLAIQAAENPKIQETFAEGEREALKALTLDSFNALKNQFGIRQYQYHTPPARSFLRLHSPENFGDDLSSFRSTVIEVNQTQQTVVGIEVGRGGAGLRGIAPVFYEGKHFGSVEFGLNIDLAFVEGLKEKYGNDWRIMLTRESLELAILEDIEALSAGPVPELLILGETLKGQHQSPDAYPIVLAGESITSQTRSNDGKILLISTVPLKDYRGKIIGVVETIIDDTALAQLQSNRLFLLLAGLLLVAVIGGFALNVSTNRALSPLQGLTNAALALQKGDFSQEVPVTSQDEIGALAATFNTMSAQLQESFTNLEKRIADRTKALETSYEVSRRISNILNPQALAREVVEQVQTSFNYYHAHVYYFDDQSENLVMAGGTGEAGAAMLASGHSIPRGRGLVGRAAESNQPVLVEDVSQTIGWLPNPLLPDTKAEAAVPIAIGDQVLGVLDVQQNTVGGLGEDDIALLQAMAAQIAISLQNARAYEQSRVQAELEATVNAIGQKIQQASTVEETLQVAISEVALAIGAARASGRLSAPVIETEESKAIEEEAEQITEIEETT